MAHREKEMFWLPPPLDLPDNPPSFRKPKKPVSEMTPEELRNCFWTPPYDPRFPNTNQTKNCYVNYLDYHRCVKVRGPEFEACKYFKVVYQHLCPLDWHEHWDEQREKGIFPGQVQIDKYAAQRAKQAAENKK